MVIEKKNKITKTTTGEYNFIVLNTNISHLIGIYLKKKIFFVKFVGRTISNQIDTIQFSVKSKQLIRSENASVLPPSVKPPNGRYPYEFSAGERVKKKKKNSCSNIFNSFRFVRILFIHVCIRVRLTFLDEQGK